MFPGLNCEGEQGCNAVNLGEHECRRQQGNFLSYQVRNYHKAKYRKAWKKGSCKLHFFLDNKCAGTEIVTDDVLSTLGTCQSAMSQTAAGLVQGVESFRLVCDHHPVGEVPLAGNQTNITGMSSFVWLTFMSLTEFSFKRSNCHGFGK